MPRPMSSAMLTALTQQVLYPAVFVQIGFASGTAYVWSGIGSITWNGNTYTGVGDLGSVSVIEEASTVEAKGIEISLSGIDSTILADAIQENQLGLSMVIYFALYDAPGGSIIADPLTSWKGYTDQPTITISGETAQITIRGESRLAFMNQPVDRRLSLEDINLRTPGDISGQFIVSIQEQMIYWGQAPTTGANI